MVFAQTTVEARKYGASRRTAAISAPSEPVPTTKTRSGSGGIPTGTIATVASGEKRRRSAPTERSRVPLAPLYAAARLGHRGRSGHRARRGLRADRHRGTALHRRRLVAVMQ